MSTDYEPAEEHFVPSNFMFDSNAHAAIVIHKTGGDATPQAVYGTFLASGNPGNSTHYAVGTDGSIWQFVPEALGAGGNGATEPGYDPFWSPYVRQYTNLNLCTLSIEHCDAALDNSTPLTSAQQEASFQLIAHLVQKYRIPLDHIKSHASIDPIDRARCPGNYPWTELFAYLQQQQGGLPPPMQLYTAASADFTHWFHQTDTTHWLCLQTNCTVQDAILAFYQQLSLDGHTLPLLGLPVTNEIYLTGALAHVVIQVYERGALCYDMAHLKGSQPGTGDVYLLHLTDPDLLAHLPGLVLPSGVPAIPANIMADARAALAAMQQLAHDAGLE